VFAGIRVTLPALLSTLIFLASSPAARAQALPAPWATADVGSPALAGTASESAGTFTIEGGGIDVGGTADQFRFVYQQITGDVDVRARVAAVEFTCEWAKGGVMIRETLAAGSRHASMFATAASGPAFVQRASTNGASTLTSGGTDPAPLWVRIVRAGSLFTSYVSDDGATWRLVGSQTIAMGDTAYVGLAVTSHEEPMLSTATFQDVSVLQTAAQPASAWSGSDVGNPAIAGSSSESSGTFSVTGAGRGIRNSADQFHYFYQPATGDVEIVAKVATLERAHNLSKGGVMIRETLDRRSAHAFMTATASRGWMFQRRPVAGGDTVQSPGTFSNVPGWVRLVREGDLFSAYESTDGVSWSLVGTETIPMAQNVHVGLAVTSHNTGAAVTATFTNVTIKAPAAGSPGNAAPAVNLTSPAAGSTYTAPASITIAASASDTDGTVSKVDFYQGSTLLGSDTSSPFTFAWTNVPEGSYSVTARATDNDGATTTSPPVAVTVGAPANTAPAVALTSPANGATFAEPATIAIAANASDGDGTVSRVDFYRGTTLLGSDTTAPYSFTWSNVPAGSYTLTARAVDNAGAAATSAAVTVTVSAVAPQPTTTVFTPSSDHDTNVTNYSVAIYRAGDPVTATPAATKNIGKPAVSNNEISADISDIVNPLPSGSYYGVVTAIGPGGSTASGPSATFAK
jgi:regulation of enolase protein 1 (concanavalin A-like superfamily)